MLGNKKGISPLGIMGSLLVVAVVVILILFLLNRWLTSQSGIVETQIGGIGGDADKDGLRNVVDKCPCTFGDSLYEGCPATFDQTQIDEDKKKYHSDPPCGMVAGETTVQTQQVPQQPTPQQKPAEQKPAEKKEEIVPFKKYQSIELFGGDDFGPDPQDDVIKQACTGWVGGTGGANCHSEDDDCDGNFNLQPLKEGCWIMGSEDDDTDPNDCGQAKVDDGTVIPVGSYRNLNVDLTNNYQSRTDEDEPKNLFQWRWKSKPEYGALLCDQGFWVGCKESQEGRNYVLRNKQAYKCTDSEWLKQ